MADNTDIIPGMAITSPAAPALCEDEGCPHYGMPHHCEVRIASSQDDLYRAPASFADAPTTIGELSANRSKQAKDWMPRDVLINVLRRVDRGEIKPDNLMVVWDDANHTSYTQSTENKYRSNWLLDRAKRMIMKDEEE